jgi:hypothetical protein
MCRFFVAKKGEYMERKTFKEYCQTDVRKFENLEKEWNPTQTSIRKKLIRYVELYGYDLSESDMEFIMEWVIESAYNVLKLNHQFDEEFKSQNKNMEISEEELELMFPSYIFE